MCKFKVGDKVKTRNGTDVEIVHRDGRLKRPVIGVLHYEDGEMAIREWSDNGAFLETKESDLDLIPLSRTVTLYPALVRTSSGRYFTPSDLFSGLDDDGIEDWNSGGCEFIRPLTEYPIEVEL